MYIFCLCWGHPFVLVVFTRKASNAPRFFSLRTLSPPTSSKWNRPTCYPLPMRIYLFVYISFPLGTPFCCRRCSRMKLMMRFYYIFLGSFHCRYYPSKTGLHAIRFGRHRRLYVRYLSISIYVYVYIHTQTCMHACMYIYIICISISMYIYIYAYLYLYVQIVFVLGTLFRGRRCSHIKLKKLMFFS